METMMNQGEVKTITVGETFEGKGWRVHLFALSIRVTETTNAGKRGKTCKELAMWIKYGEVSLQNYVGAYVELAAKGGTYEEMKEAMLRDLRIEKFLDMEENEHRGVDVVPSGFKPVKVNTEHLSLEAGYGEFVVSDKRDMNNEPTLIPSTKGGKKAAKDFFKWATENRKALETMTFSDVTRSLREKGIGYHFYCAMD